VYDAVIFAIQYYFYVIQVRSEMLSVRLPEDLEAQLDVFCRKQHMQKSKVVQIALRRHLSQVKDDPFLALIGSGNGKYTTDEIMRMTRGEDWNQP
jgi:predicted DNA-binding protein